MDELLDSADHGVGLKIACSRWLLASRACDAMLELMPTNVLGGVLKCCCTEPMTGFYRDGYCRTGPGDHGVHTVCAVMTEEFLEFSAAAGNDLSTPDDSFGFPGLKAGDKWCLCVTRWKDALELGCAPKVVLEATHSSAVEFVDLEDLKTHAT